MRGWRVLLFLPLPLALAAFYFTRSTGTVVFLISLDTVRADRLGCYSYDAAQTPFIDQLASKGTVFDHAITAAPFTPSSHASIFTGLCPCKHGVRFAWRFHRQQLTPGVKTLAELFKAQGYATAAFVSARPMDKSIHSLDRGFDVYDQSFMGDKSRKGELQHQRRADETLESCFQWLDSHRAPRLFVFIHLFDVHDGEVSPPPLFKKEYLTRLGGHRFDRYDYEIAWMDLQLGKFFAKVKPIIGRRRLQVALLADHGEGLGDHGYNRHAERVYQEQLRVPFVWSGAGIPIGRRIDAYVRTIDILPTLADLYHLDRPPAVQGASLLPLMQGRDTADRICYSETRHPMTNEGEALFSLIKDRRKLIYAPESGRFEYYNLTADPKELHDLASTGGFDDLLAELKKHDLSTTPPRETDGEKEKLAPEVEEGLRSLGYVN